MKQLVIFNTPILVPIDEENSIESYGLVIEKQSWEKAKNSNSYIRYVLACSELCRNGFCSANGIEFCNDEVSISYLNSKIWNEYKKKVMNSGIRFAVIKENVELDENDYVFEYMTNKEKWTECIRKNDIVWQK